MIGGWSICSFMVWRISLVKIPLVADRPATANFVAAGKNLCFGSGSGLDPDSIRPVDLNPDSEYGSGSRRAKMTNKKKKREISCFAFSLRAEGFSCTSDVLYSGQGISTVPKLQFDQKISKLFVTKFFSKFWSSNTRSGSVFSLKCWIRNRTQRIRIRNIGKNSPLESKKQTLTLKHIKHNKNTVL